MELVLDKSKKHCQKRRKCWLLAFSALSTKALSCLGLVMVRTKEVKVDTTPQQKVSIVQNESICRQQLLLKT